jgi:hypothetical protein
VTLRAHLLVWILTLVYFLAIFRLVRHRKLRAKYALLWILVAIAIIPLAVFPRLLDIVSSDVLGVAYPPAALLVIGLLFFCLLNMHFSFELTRLEERSRVLAEEVALLRAGQEAARSDTDAETSDASG